MNTTSWLNPLAALVLSPLLPGIINRTKAFFAGRRGQPLLQGYYDIAKLLHKGAVYSRTTSWIFRAGPVVGLAAVLMALVLLPLGGSAAPLNFTGDIILLAYLLGLMRFFTVIAALDTGSAFEGMGASREVQFSVLTEPALLLSLAAMGKAGQIGSGSRIEHLDNFLSLSGIYSNLSASVWMRNGTILLLVAGALLIVLLAESPRIPVDDPNTHLELTMIHEVMVLDHGGPDFAMILYGAALKLWVFSALLAGVLIPVRSAYWWLDAGAVIGGIFLLAVVIGVIESSMARLRLLRVPQLLTGAGVLSILAFALILWR
ncbi:MAG: NADH-quinone oxidoreductase subunit H [Deltaproteobacteria bacterium]|nr:NADH-quinone oxidoreductase subunit H [Deltaproteobacteria bacterium]